MRLLQIRDNPDLLLHDTSALRLSYTLNRIGYQHSLGAEPIHLSKYGTDSIKGAHGDQFIFHPLAFGPYLADKYGYPNVSKLHIFDPVKIKENFKNKQGIMRVITYTQRDNEPKGHVALWDCNGFYKARDFMSGHTLLSVEFWESPGKPYVSYLFLIYFIMFYSLWRLDNSILLFRLFVCFPPFP